jgi:hypothetical protein
MTGPAPCDALTADALTAGALITELLAVLKQAAPYVLDSARRHERLGLGEEAAMAWAVYRRAQWAVRAAGNEQPAPAAVREYED